MTRKKNIDHVDALPLPRHALTSRSKARAPGLMQSSAEITQNSEKQSEDLDLTSSLCMWFHYYCCTPEHKTKPKHRTVQRDGPDQTEPHTHTHVSGVMGASFRKSPAHATRERARAENTPPTWGAKEGEEQEHRQDGTTEGGSRAEQSGAEQRATLFYESQPAPSRSLPGAHYRVQPTTLTQNPIPLAAPHIARTHTCHTAYRHHTAHAKLASQQAPRTDEDLTPNKNKTRRVNTSQG